jgi:cytochrome b561
MILISPAAQNTKPKETTLGKSKMEWMNLHKSIALIVAALLPGRVMLRLLKDAPVSVLNTC